MGWTVVSEIWLFFCVLVAVVYPVVDGRKVLARAFTLFFQSLTGRKMQGLLVDGMRHIHLLQKRKWRRLRVGGFGKVGVNTRFNHTVSRRFHKFQCWLRLIHNSMVQRLTCGGLLEKVHGYTIKTKNTVLVYFSIHEAYNVSVCNSVS